MSKTVFLPSKRGNSGDGENPYGLPSTSESVYWQVKKINIDFKLESLFKAADENSTNPGDLSRVYKNDILKWIDAKSYPITNVTEGHFFNNLHLNSGNLHFGLILPDRIETFESNSIIGKCFIHDNTTNITPDSVVKTYHAHAMSSIKGIAVDAFGPWIDDNAGALGEATNTWLTTHTVLLFTETGNKGYGYRILKTAETMSETDN
jgi:hypothetical protein